MKRETLTILDARETPLKSIIKDCFTIFAFGFLGYVNHQYLGGGWVYQLLIVITIICASYKISTSNRMKATTTKEEAIAIVNKFFDEPHDESK